MDTHRKHAAMGRCRAACRVRRGRQSAAANGRRRGAATVELALIMPFLLALTLGICELGQAFKVEAILSEAARKACATASRPGCSNADVIADAQSILTANKLPTGSVTVTILVNDQAGNTLTAKKNDKLTITVSIPVSQVNWTNTLTYLGSRAKLSQTIVMVKQG